MRTSSDHWPLPTAQRAIIVAGCLSMVYTQLSMSPATIEFARALGAQGVHFGILGALPTVTLFFQFLAALVANHLRYRRGLWLAVSLVQRMILVPAALGPWLFPDVGDAVWIWGLIAATALNHALLHFCTPLWLSWMGDYLPRQGLSRYWGVRHLWMQLAGAVALLAAAFFLFRSGMEMTVAFALLMGIGALFGLADLLLFLKIDEPPVRPAEEPRLVSVLSAPFRHGQFRTFIGYTCFWHFAAMVGAPFISLYLLVHVGLALDRVLVLWTFSWIGGALLSRRLGVLAEEHGNRPVLILCTALKSANMIALLLVPAEPVLAFWVLVPVFMLDAALNAGITIATNGFLLKNSPAENRTMYIAAGTAVAGMVGGLASVAAGVALSTMEGSSLRINGSTFNGFHALFLASLVLRWTTLLVVRRIREPDTSGAKHVAGLLIGATPLRVLRFPLGLYRSLGENGNGPRAEPTHQALDCETVRTRR